MKSSVAVVAFTVLVAAAALSPMTFATTASAAQRQTEDNRQIVIISDLHMGVGKEGGAWSPLEDFRWSRALSGFLDAISQEGNGQVTLVIAGDLLELWQHPKTTCAGHGPNEGCTPEEMKQIVETVTAAHSDDLVSLGKFADRADNRLVIVPGNHDAALLIPIVWDAFASKIQAHIHPPVLEPTGIWSSADGRVVVEHGQQIGEDPNKWPTWPNILTPDGKYMIRTWGEYWVQEEFNRAEMDYPLVDNVIPQTRGLVYYFGDRGIAGTGSDLAKFLYFNVVETSLAQKISLGPTPSPTAESQWNTADARTRLGFKLFAYSLPEGDPLRTKLLVPPDANWSRVQTSLTLAAQNTTAMPDDRVDVICDYLNRRASAAGDQDICKPKHLGGALILSAILNQRSVLTTHLNKRLRYFPRMSLFVYGHTHQMQDLGPIDGTTVFNDGAFQRLIDSASFVRIATEHHVTAAKALKVVPLEELPACYSAVTVKYLNGSPVGELRNWHMNEEDRVGSFVGQCDPRCAVLSNTCGPQQ